MAITVGFVALFISIVIPGLLFQRFYFYGEFSKQFTTKDPVIRSLVYAIIPSLIIQTVCLSFYVTVINPTFELSELFSVHRNLLEPKEELNVTTKAFLNKNIVSFLWYSVSVYVLSMLFGYIFSRLVRGLRLDRSRKLFRYKNQWFYILSGEIQQFGKFKSAANILNKPDPNRFKIDMVFADVLVKCGDGSTNLYTGYVVDYDLDSTDISKLDKIYLLEAHRYKRVEVKNPDSTELHPMKVDKKPILGSVFVLPVDDLVNINLLYVTSKKQKLASNLRLLRKKFLLISAFLLLVLFLIIMSHISFVQVSWIKYDWYNDYFENTGWFDKFLGFFLYLQVLSFFLPKKTEDKGKPKFFADLWLKFLMLGILSALFLWLNYDWMFY